MSLAEAVGTRSSRTRAAPAPRATDEGWRVLALGMWVPRVLRRRGQARQGLSPVWAKGGVRGSPWWSPGRGMAAFGRDGSWGRHFRLGQDEVQRGRDLALLQLPGAAQAAGGHLYALGPLTVAAARLSFCALEVV